MSDVAKRLVACKHFQWMRGMLGRGGSFGQLLVRLRRGDEGRVASDVWPDLTDPGTMGCLLALVAEAYGVALDDVHVVRTTGMVWSVWIFRSDDSSYRVATHEPSRTEALVAALEVKE